MKRERAQERRQRRICGHQMEAPVERASSARNEQGEQIEESDQAGGAETDSLQSAQAPEQIWVGFVRAQDRGEITHFLRKPRSSE
jgi:hypothetical protein